MKKCKDCFVTKDESEFYGVQGECKKCTKKRVSKNYRENREQYAQYEKKRSQDPVRKKKALEYQRKRRKKHPMKNKCRQFVNNAIRDGKLFKEPCEICGNKKVEAHHSDYRSPTKIQWLCREHHLELEGKTSYLKSPD